MNYPGPFQLLKDGGAFNIGAAGTFVGDWSTDFQGILALALQLRFVYGSGGTSATIYIQTSLDHGQTAIDIAAIQFATATAEKAFNFSALTPQMAVVPTDQALAAGEVVDGLLGDRFRAVVVVDGTYGGSTLLTIAGNAR